MLLRSTTLVLIAFTLCACKAKQDNAPPASGGGNQVPVGGGTSGKHDAAVKAQSEDDGGSENPDSGAKPPPVVDECTEVKAMNFIPEDLQPGMFVNAISSPSDFSVTRVKLTWEASCADPTIRLEMSDGACPNGNGHSLVFRFPVRAIEDGTIRVGQNTITSTVGADATTDAIDIRYTRPQRLVPTGTWGSCESANGTVDILGELTPKMFSTMQGRFDLELTDCTSSGLPIQSVMGSFSATLRRTLSDVCPNAP